MIRTLEHNSTQQTKEDEMRKLKDDLVRSGYAQEELEMIEEQAIEQTNTDVTEHRTETITFPLFYFKGFNEFKKIITDSSAELQQIIGETKIVMAVKKNPSIGSRFVQNKQLSVEEIQLPNQKCNATNCNQCPLVNTSKTIMVNNKRVHTSKTLNCKSRNVIYLWQCKLCRRHNSYFGRTIQKSHKRTNTHRGCFSDPSKWEDSALSVHARKVHGNVFDLKNFKITLVKKCSPQRIRREEFKYIDKYETRTFGINRYKN